MRGTVIKNVLNIPKRVQEGNVLACCWSAHASCSRSTSSSRLRTTRQAHAQHRARHFSSSAANIVSPDLTFRSPIPDVVIPENWTVHDEIFKACDTFKDAIAIEEFATGRTISYTSLKESAIRAASSLHAAGYSKGDVILAFSINSIDFTILALACSCLGVWFSPANATFIPSELARQIQLSGATAVFTSDVLAPITAAALADTEATGKIKGRYVFGSAEGFQPFSSLIDSGSLSLPSVSIDPRDDVFTLPYSSGTTGLPKGVMLTHRNVVANLHQMDSTDLIHPSDPMLALLPFSHIYGLTVNLLLALQQGARLVALPKFDPESFLKCMHFKKIKVAPLVPPLILFLTKHPVVSRFDLTSTTSVFSAAAALGKEMTEEFYQRHTHGVTVLQGYGLTETSPAINTDTVGVAGSVGCLVPNTIGKMIDPDTRQPVGPGQEGEYWITGPQVMKGYHNNEQATRDMITEDGWLQTGDLGYYTEEGHVYICERLKELIKYKGSQVSPAELENLLLTHPGVADCAVIGVEDQVAGELPRAYVVGQPGQEVTEEDIVNFVDGQVSKAKKLRGGVEFVEAIPKNPSGKILRRVLRAKAKASASS